MIQTSNWLRRRPTRLDLRSLNSLNDLMFLLMSDDMHDADWPFVGVVISGYLFGWYGWHWDGDFDFSRVCTYDRV